MNVNQYLSRAQIEALPIEKVEGEYEKAKTYLDELLAKVETDNSLKAVLTAHINSARIQYVFLRERAYSAKYFNKIQLAA